MANSLTLDKTSWIPFILFGIFAAIVAYCVIKGTKKGDPIEAELPGRAKL